MQCSLVCTLPLILFLLPVMLCRVARRAAVAAVAPLARAQPRVAAGPFICRHRQPAAAADSSRTGMEGIAIARTDAPRGMYLLLTLFFFCLLCACSSALPLFAAVGFPLLVVVACASCCSLCRFPCDPIPSVAATAAAVHPLRTLLSLPYFAVPQLALRVPALPSAPSPRRPCRRRRAARPSRSRRPIGTARQSADMIRRDRSRM